MKTICREQCILIPAHIDRMSERFREVLDAQGIERKECLRLRLSLEEILLNWLEKNEGAEIRLFVEGKRGKLHITMETEGKEQDPLAAGEAYGSTAMADRILSGLGLVWSYQYTGGVNQVSIRVEGKKPGQFWHMGAAFILAVFTGAAFGYLPAQAARAVTLYLTDPLFDTFMGILSAVVGPMMFLSVAWGVLSIGSPGQLGSIGKKVCGTFLARNCLTALLGAAAVAAFFPFRIGGGGGGGSQMKALLDMLYDIIPDNAVSPFITGNTMQIIFLAVVVGITMNGIRDQVPAAAAVVEQCNVIVQRILAAVSRLVPAFIYLSIVRLVLSGQTEHLAGIAKMVLLYLALSALLIVLYLAGVWKRLRVSPAVVIKKVLPTYLIALTTGSSAAAFAECVDCCERKLGIDRKLVDFGLPLGIVIFMPNFALWLVLFGGACAEYAGTVLTPADLLAVAVIGVFLAVAAPPVPGGAITCYTILLMQMNMPMEMLAVAAAVNVVVDFTGTAGHMLANQIELLQCAADLGMLDRKILEN